MSGAPSRNKTSSIPYTKTFLIILSMDPSTIFLFITFVLLLAFFAGTEIPLMSVSEHKLETFRKLGKYGSQSLEIIRKDPEKLLIVNLIGTTIVTIAASSLSTVVAIDAAHQFGLSGDQAVAIAVLITSGIILLFGEIAPKIVGVRYLDRTALAVAPIYRFLLFICTPLNFLIHFFVRFIGLLTGGKTDIHSGKISQEELEAFIDLSAENGAVEEHEHKKIKGILDLGDTEASSVMTPRVRVEFIKQEMTVSEAVRYFLATSHSRLPVCGDHTDDVDFVVTLREVLAWEHEGKGNVQLKDLTLDKIIKIPVTKPIDTVFEIFQKSHKHIALVIDEHGGVAGVITLEDIVEEVFGDIKDEKDQEDEYMRMRPDGSLTARGEILVDDVLESFEDLDFDDLDLEEYRGETLAYLIISKLQSFPDENEKIIIGNLDRKYLELTILEIEDETIGEVRVVYKK